MKVPSDSRFAAWKYVEVAAYKEWRDRETGKQVQAVIREKDREADIPIMYEWGEEVERFRRSHDNVGVYTSVFRYNDRDMDRATRLGSLYFDFDDEDLTVAYRDMRELCVYLRHVVPGSGLRVYFTGAKGFHVEAEARVLGIDPSNNLANIFRFMAEFLEKELKLTTLDFAVYDPRRMWRLPNSRHQRSGLYKVEIMDEDTFNSLDKILESARAPKEYDVPDHLMKPGRHANEWYKSWVVRYEEHQEKQRQDALKKRKELFIKYGSSLSRGHTRKYVNKVWKSSLESLKNIEEGKRNMTLSRQAYKLYLTMLEANLPIDEVTSALQSVGVDIGLDEREVRETLKSAHRAATKKYDEQPRSLYE